MYSTVLIMSSEKQPFSSKSKRVSLTVYLVYAVGELSQPIKELSILIKKNQ